MAQHATTDGTDDFLTSDGVDDGPYVAGGASEISSADVTTGWPMTEDPAATEEATEMEESTAEPDDECVPRTTHPASVSSVSMSLLATALVTSHRDWGPFELSAGSQSKMRVRFLC